MISFRIATYNVHKCRGVDWKVSVPRIAAVIREVAADVVTVQEIFSGQAAAIAEELELLHIFGSARTLAGDAYGNATYSRVPILQSEAYDLTVRMREPRQCLRTELRLGPDAILHFFGVHLGTSFFERRRQANALLSQTVLERPDLKGARIVAGDFNEWTRGLATQMLGQHLQSADIAAHLRRRRTYPGLLPLLHLDHIYYDPAFHLTKMYLHRTPKSRIASDHLPLVADFQTRPPAAHHASRFSMRTR